MDYRCKFCSVEYNQANKAWCEKYCDEVQQNINVLRIFAKWRLGADIVMPEPSKLKTALKMVNEMF